MGAEMDCGAGTAAACASTYRVIDDASGWAELELLWPINKFPLIRDDDAVVMESSIIVEYLALHYPGPTQLLPADDDAALRTRFMDRVFDNYVMTPMQTLVSNRGCVGNFSAGMARTGEMARRSEFRRERHEQLPTEQIVDTHPSAPLIHTGCAAVLVTWSAGTLCYIDRGRFARAPHGMLLNYMARNGEKICFRATDAFVAFDAQKSQKNLLGEIWDVSGVTQAYR